MNVARLRVAPAVEWIVAAGFLLATLVVGSLIVRELRTAVPAPASTAAAATERAAAVLPAGVPSRAISVPALLLLDGKQVRVGDSVERIATLLGRGAETGAQSMERGPIGERLTRAYEHAGTRFILVFEPFELGGRPRVAGIYIQ